MMTAALLTTGAASAFDHDYRAYAGVLSAHVHWIADGHASVVDYGALKRDRAALDDVLAEWSSVTPQAFADWTRAQQMAFLINAYNGFTLKLIVDHYPDLKSIRDLGSLFRSPWKQSFFRLLGDERTLDWVEHERLRPDYHDARVHFAVNCASIGCPALRPEPFTAARLDTQLDDQLRRFLGDRTRNRYKAQDDTLYVSQIFRWYGDDFAVDGRSLDDWFIAHADLLADDTEARAKLRKKTFDIDHLSYNWMLNASGR